MYWRPINYVLGRRSYKDVDDRMLPHAPIKHTRGQNNVFLNYIPFGVLLQFYEVTI